MLVHVFDMFIYRIHHLAGVGIMLVVVDERMCNRDQVEFVDQNFAAARVVKKIYAYLEVPKGPFVTESFQADQCCNSLGVIYPNTEP